MIAYLDASAAVKLIRAEPQSAALAARLSATLRCVSSELLEVELVCVARRLGGGEPMRRAATVLAGIDLVPYSAAIRSRACGEFQPAQRALDAIHLATALDLGLDRLVLLSYDQNQAGAGRAAGLLVESPC